MEPTRFHLTPEQKGMLASLLSETGEPVPTLIAAIAEALEELQQEHPHPLESPQTAPPLWERIRETFSNLSEEDVNSLPIGGSAQVDHYAYGLPKR